MTRPVTPTRRRSTHHEASSSSPTPMRRRHAVEANGNEHEARAKMAELAEDITGSVMTELTTIPMEFLP